MGWSKYYANCISLAQSYWYCAIIVVYFGIIGISGYKSTLQQLYCVLVPRDLWPCDAGINQCKIQHSPVVKKKTHNRHPIAHPYGWAMGCLLWVQIMIYVLPLQLPLQLYAILCNMWRHYNETWLYHIEWFNMLNSIKSWQNAVQNTGLQSEMHCLFIF